LIGIEWNKQEEEMYPIPVRAQGRVVSNRKTAELATVGE